MGIRSSMSRLFSDAGTNKAPTGTGYTNLNRFLGANAGNQLGAKVSGNLQNQIGTVQNQLADEKTSFEQQAEKNRLDTAENAAARDSIIGRFASPSTEGGTLGDEDISKVTQFRTGQYAGPKGLQDTTALSQQAQDLASQTGNLSSSGTQELLRRTIGGGRYTQGQQRLDSILMDRSGLKQVGREAQALGSDVNRANLAAQGQAQALAGQAQQFGVDTTNQLKGALTGLDTAAQGQLDAAQAAENDRLARVQAIQDFAAGKVAKKDASGNIIKDAYGNVQYDTSANVRGGDTGVQQLDYLRNILSTNGADQAEIDSLLGAGNFAQGQQQYNAAQQAARDASTAAFNKDYYAARDQQAQDIANGVDPRDVLNSIGGVMMDFDNSQNYDYFLNQALNGDALYQGQKYTQYGDPIRQQATQDFYGTRGLAGQALQNGNLENLYSNLGKAVGNSAAAQNLTKEAVAAQPIRSNYTALAQLLGTPDVNPYTTDAQYTAGNLLLNPNQIRNALGY